METAHSHQQTLRSYAGAVLFLFCLCLLPYGNILHAPFQFDSVSHIKSNNYIIDYVENNNREAFFRQYGWDNISNRPFLNYTYLLNYYLGKDKTLGYHLINIQIHFCVVLLIYLLTRKTLQLAQAKGLANPAPSANLPLLTAALFAVHPVHTESISNIISRSITLCTFLYLSAFYCCVRALEVKEFRPHPVDGEKWFLISGWLIAAAVLFRIALGVKLTAISFPISVGIYYIFFNNSGFDLKQRIIKNPISSWTVILGLAALTIYKLIFSNSPLLQLNDPAAHLYGQKNYFLSQIQWSVFYYLKVLAFPINLNVDPDVELIRSWSAPGVWAGVLMIAALGIGLFRTSPLAGFAFFWFAVALAPESSFVPLLDLVAEHRLYLPGIGLTLAAAIILGKQRSALVPCLLMICLAVTTTNRNADWLTEGALWRDTIKKSPLKARPLSNYARALIMDNDLHNALITYEKSIILDTSSMEAFHNIGNLYSKLGDCTKAIEAHKRALAIDPNVADSMLTIGQCYKMSGDYDQAVAFLKLAAQTDSRMSDAFVELGIVYYFYLKKSQEGLFYFRQALRISPDHPSAPAMQSIIDQVGSTNPHP